MNPKAIIGSIIGVGTVGGVAGVGAMVYSPTQNHKRIIT